MQNQPEPPNRSHGGMSCSQPTGPNYFSGSGGDPWPSAKYDGSATPSNALFVEVETGLSRDDVLGRTVIIFDVTGAPIACSIIEDCKSRTICFTWEWIPTYQDLCADLAMVEFKQSDQVRRGELLWRPVCQEGSMRQLQTQET